jgi:hypothetical protein
MKKLFLMATIGAALIAVAPASAQVHFGAGPGGVGVEVGPGPHPGWRRDHFRDRFAYERGCRVMYERTVTPSGRMISTTRRVCG